MSTGIELFTESGVKFFSTASQTWSFIGSFIAPAGQSATATFGSIALMSEVIFQRSLVDDVPGNQEAIVHTAYLSGTTVVAQGGSVRSLIIVLGR